MGIPLLYPWANRLGAQALRARRPRGRHRPRARRRCGSTAAGCRCTACSARRAAGGSSATSHDGGACSPRRFDFAADDGLMAAFPFPHELRSRRTLDGGRRCTIATTVAASATRRCRSRSASIPTSRCPASTRADWEVEIPVHRASCGSTTGCSRPASASRSTIARRAARRRARSTTPTSPAGRRAVRARRRRPADRARVRRGLPVRAGVRAAGRRRDRVRADDRADQRARRRRRLPLLAPGDSYRAVFSIRRCARRRFVALPTDHPMSGWPPDDARDRDAGHLDPAAAQLTGRRMRSVRPRGRMRCEPGLGVCRGTDAQRRNSCRACRR